MSEELRTWLKKTADRNYSSVPQQDGWVFSSIEDLAQRHGRSFTPAGRIERGWRLHESEKEVVAHCYAIATMRYGAGWVFVEGWVRFAKTGRVKPHTWLTRTDTPNIAYDMEFNSSKEPIEYFGVPLFHGYVKHCFKGSGYKSYSALDTPWNNWSLLRKTKLLEKSIHSLKQKSPLEGVTKEEMSDIAMTVVMAMSESKPFQVPPPGLNEQAA